MRARPLGAGTLVLGIESSCDDTAVALVRGGRDVLASVVLSQALEHAPFGGVVPEIAGRSHLRNLMPVIERAFEEAALRLDDVDALAVTRQPGLIGSLLVGLSAAKALAFVRGLPMVGVHHIQAHAYAAFLEHEVRLPALALVVSGGHTALYRMTSPTRLELLGETLDDAAGEAFDKIACLLGLGYPGGPALAELARQGNPIAFDFPRYRSRDGRPGFSFSGLKTAVLYHLRGQDVRAPTPPPTAIPRRADVAASFEEAIVDVLVGETLRAAESQDLSTVIVAGGVACNARLRERMNRDAGERGLRAIFPSPRLCADNAAMVAGLGFALLVEGRRDGLDLDASAC
jgi:N6-L-threonylcarbamoyladenine synthase